jgi:hypothetical protein
MLAVIQRSAVAGAALFPLAGRPLIVRQLQWLRDLGVERIAVEIGADEEGLEVGEWLAERDAVGVGVQLVLAGRRLDPRGLARRAGFPADEPLLVVPGDVLGGGAALDELLARAGARGGRLRMQVPAGAAARLRGGELLVLPASDEIEELTGARAPGWAVRLRSPADALALGVLALSASTRGERPRGMPLHAAEHAPGIWVGRGAQIDPGARLIAPVLIGAEAVIRAAAEVGPNAFVGERAVVDQGTTLANGIMLDGVIAGEGLDLRGLSVAHRELVDLRTGARFEVDDTLILASRARGRGTSLPSRVIALALLLTLLPCVALGALVLGLAGRRGRRPPLAALIREIIEVSTGARGLIGLGPLTGARPEGVPLALWRASQRAAPGVIHVDRALTPACSGQQAQLHARLCYAHTKCLRVDLSLLTRSALSFLGSSRAEAPVIAAHTPQPAPPRVEPGLELAQIVLPGLSARPLDATQSFVSPRARR